MDVNDNGEYVSIQGESRNGRQRVHVDSVPPNPKSWKWWVKIIALCILLGILTIFVVKWIGPLFMRKVVVPIIKWEVATFSPPGLAVIIFVSIAIFPLILLPSTPSMWIAGMTFGYGIGFLLVMAGVSVGVSLPYFIGSLFNDKIYGWLDKHPKQASILRLAGEGDLVHQFKAITLIRISPFPYVICNYAVVASDVKYIPYLLGSLLGMVPDVFIALYSGILINTFADATRDHNAPSTRQIIFNVCGFCAAVTATVIIGIYTKRRLNQLEEEDPIL
ncbi:SNARE_assoc domain-containing protein [Cephalotus follicularis]|uniref:SNARE_assoc domain-containing protein n=1 Tax=Cephalotus follicularis TaxID=3775 RepID=A0A1Q3C664_CEPFO|nr:SNARE_assoc domain-containing protein [Cephalotus follicularis]